MNTTQLSGKSGQSQRSLNEPQVLHKEGPQRNMESPLCQLPQSSRNSYHHGGPSNNYEFRPFRTVNTSEHDKLNPEIEASLPFKNNSGSLGVATFGSKTSSEQIFN